MLLTFLILSNDLVLSLEIAVTI